MLKSLQIKNYALIESLEFSPSPQFNIITGETGAGKSIMLGAIALLTGARADIKSLLDKEQKCIIEGVFDISAYELNDVFEVHEVDYEAITIIRREITPQGKSRAFINDMPVNLETIKEITGRLLDVHSQHDNLMLGSEDFQLEIVDIFAQNSAILNQYRIVLKNYKKLKKQVEELKSVAANAKKDFDYVQFLFTELVGIQLAENEQETLEEELNILENADEIKLKLNLCIQTLTEGDFSVITELGSVVSNMNQATKLSSTYESLRERGNSCLAELKDIAKELQQAEEKTEIDPLQLVNVRNRLDNIYKLQKKHNLTTVKGLIDLKDELGNKLNSYNSTDEKINEIEIELRNTNDQLAKIADQLTETRLKEFKKIECKLTDQLKQLGMPNNNFIIKHESTDYTMDGKDKISMLFSANRGVEPIALKNSASGGEFSRLMFALKYIIAEISALPTMIFDEIDTGISGETAIKMGEMMKKMASGHQLITITHLHQIAGKGDSHFFVYKDETPKGTKTNIRKLNPTDRLQEIAEMIGGKNPSHIAYESAKEMLSK